MMSWSKLAKHLLSGSMVLHGGFSYADHPALVFGSESSGPINTISAFSMPQHAVSAGIRTEVINFNRFSDTRLETFASNGEEGVHSVDSLVTTSVSLVYGVTDNFSVSARLPYVKRTRIRESELEDGEAEAHAHGDADGLGDLAVLGQYRFLEGGRIDMALLAGIKIPTGSTTQKDGDERLEAEFQPGSGSWDGLFGLSASTGSDRLGLHASLLYSLTTEGDQRTETGDAFFYNLGVTMNLSDAIHQDAHQHNHSHLRWDLILELNGETRDKTRVDGHNEANTGGKLLYLSPGIRVSSSTGWGVFLSVGLPVADDLNGTQTETDYRIVGGLGFAFE